MSHRTRFEWLSLHGRARRRTEFSAAPYSRRLRLESLEDRRLLSITVNTLIDENNGIGVGAGTSLREAIVAAMPGDTVDFSPTLTSGGPATSFLTLGELLINKSLTINGPGSNLLTIDASSSDGRIFNVNLAGVVINVTISGLTLTGGNETGGGFGAHGGAIANAESLTVSNMIIVGNFADAGGGIYNGGTLAVIGSTISGNTARGNSFPINPGGGGIANDGGSLTVKNSTISDNVSRSYPGGGISSRGIATITSSTVSNNTTPREGGGIVTGFLELTVIDSVISGNTAGFGGGIGSSPFSSSDVTVIRSTISENSATGSGFPYGSGGGVNVTGELTITSSTISSNTATENGGGIYSSGRLSVADTTISGNSAGDNGGGVFFRSDPSESMVRSSTITANSAFGFGNGLFLESGTLELDHTIVARNSFEDVAGLLGTVLDLKYSLISRNTNSGLAEAPVGSPDANGNLIGGPVNGAINPRLGPLADNGGPTMTHALLVGSPAIDAGDPTAVPGGGSVPLYDQRGVPFGRVVNGDAIGGARIDMGAIERQPIPPAVFGDYNRDNANNSADYVVWRKTLGTTGIPAYSGADGDGDTTVDPGDYGVWVANFGETLPSGAGGASEEPLASNSLFSRDAERSAEVVRGLDVRGSQESSVKSQAPERDSRVQWLNRGNALVAWHEGAGDFKTERDRSVKVESPPDDESRDPFAETVDAVFEQLLLSL